jgi:hypothetical protein
VEAVWAGDFSAGGFDEADIVVGTGIRIRDSNVIFVSSSDTLNRLHHFRDIDTLYVSNSLPALMALAESALLDGYDYAAAMETIKNGLMDYVHEIPSTRGPIHLTYFHNLIVSESHLSRAARPSSAPDFTDLAIYRDYLFASARSLGENARAPERRHGMTLLASVSSGYDSLAAAVLAREAGARDAVTIGRARRTPAHMFNLNDSGAPAARQLGLSCEVYSRRRKNYPFEDALWASMGNVGDINLALFNYPSKLCLLFTGFIGDVVWDKEEAHQIEFLKRKDTSGARFSECRLELGVFNCSPAFWGCQKADQICALSKRSEMRPWTLGTDYDRPIPRRLAEEAGITRDLFGNKKRLSSFSRRYGRPLSVDLRQDFAVFMKQRGERAVGGALEGASLMLRGLDSYVLSRMPESIRFSCRDWIALPSASIFFVWANERLRRRYLAGLSNWNSSGTSETAHVEPLRLREPEHDDLYLGPRRARRPIGPVKQDEEPNFSPAARRGGGRGPD